MSVFALILAGGTGSRTGLSVPKQFIQLKNKPIICHTVEQFSTHPRVDSIIIVSHPDHIAFLKSLMAEHKYRKIRSIVAGGNTRQESSFNGITATAGSADDIVLIHDAARPFVSEKIISDSIDSAILHGACLPAVAPTDSLFEHEENSFIKKIIDRKSILCAQTPQAFRYEIIKKAHDTAIAEKFNEATDDTSLVLRLGLKCAVTEGSIDNIKITTARDIKIAEALIQ